MNSTTGFWCCLVGLVLTQVAQGTDASEPISAQEAVGRLAQMKGKGVRLVLEDIDGTLLVAHAHLLQFAEILSRAGRCNRHLEGNFDSRIGVHHFGHSAPAPVANVGTSWVNGSTKVATAGTTSTTSPFLAFGRPQQI